MLCYDVLYIFGYECQALQETRAMAQHMSLSMTVP